MAAIEKWLKSVLRTDPGVVAVLGTRTFPVFVPQAAPYPAATFRRVRTQRDRSMDFGPDGRAKPTFHIVVHSQDYDQVRAGADAIRMILDGWPIRGQVEVQVGTQIFRIRQVALVDEYDDDSPPINEDGIPILNTTLVFDVTHTETYPRTTIP